MSDRPSRLTVLAEDENHQKFIRGYLRQWGFNPRNVRLVEIPDGKGAGDQFVRENFPREVRALQKRGSKAKTALIAVIDADAHSTNERRSILEKALLSADVQRNAHDRIVVLIPKRNIETWIFALRDARNGDPAIDETTRYPKSGVSPDDANAAGRNLYKHVAQTTPLPLPALNEAATDLRSFKFFGPP